MNTESKFRSRVLLIGLLFVITLVLVVLTSRWWKSPANERPAPPPAAAIPDKQLRPKSSPVGTPEAAPKKKRELSMYDPKRPAVTVRLKPGESAVASYLDISPGKNGMVIVTPVPQPDGSVRMLTRLVSMTDDAVKN